MDQQVKLMNKVLHADKYNVKAKLAQGSYGQIFLVSDKQTAKNYVLKALQLKKLIKQERLHQAYVQSLILRKLSHPGIIKIHETIQKQQYFSEIIDYCPYGDLFKLMSRVNQSLNLAKKKKQIMVFYLAQILEALCYIHNEQIIHRDFKPENIVVAQDLSIKLIDFGTAKINNDQYLSEIEKINIEGLKIKSKQNDKQLVGSAHYLSPQGLKCQYSEKSDIWAFGVMVFKFYHNQLPFVGTNNFEIFKNIKESTPQIDEDIPLDLKQIIQLCLRKNPQERPAAGMLKNFAFFKGINFAKIFETKSPIDQEQFVVNENTCLLESPKKVPRKQLLCIQLEKKMFFGNYKPRLLSLRNKQGKLYFAYQYVDTKITKNEVQINMNDYCQAISKNEFEIKSDDDKSYVFRCTPKQDITQIVKQINQVIRQHFKLQA